jgi:hypothetical protein
MDDAALDIFYFADTAETELEHVGGVIRRC